jgi:serine/threonine protein kinase
MDIDTIREVKFLNNLSHPNIVKIYDIFTPTPKHPKEGVYKSLYIVMDYMVPLTDLIYNFETHVSEYNKY